MCIGAHQMDGRPDMEKKRQAIGSHRVYRELRARALRLRDILHATQGRIADRAAVTAAGAADQPPALHADELWGYAMLAHLRDDAELALDHAQACISVGNTWRICRRSAIGSGARRQVCEQLPAAVHQ